MTRFSAAVVFGLALSISGCGNPTGNTNVGANADKDALAEYEANMAADQKAINEANAATPPAK